MRLDGERKYKRVSDHQFVDAEEPESSARRLQRSPIRLNFTLKEWRLVASTAGLPDGAEPPELTWIEDRAPQLDLRLELAAAKRRFYAVRDGEAAIPIDSPINFRILGSQEDKTVGYLRHVPAWEYEEEAHDHSINGALYLPPERMAWVVEQLQRPNARLHVTLHAPLYKEEIALAFDRPWYSQDIALPYEEPVSLLGYELDVVAGPQPLDDDRPEPEEEDAFEADYTLPEEQAAPAVSQVQVVTIADPRIGWMLYLLAALVVIELFRR